MRKQFMKLILSFAVFLGIAGCTASSSVQEVPYFYSDTVKLEEWSTSISGHEGAMQLRFTPLEEIAGLIKNGVTDGKFTLLYRIIIQMGEEQMYLDENKTFVIDLKSDEPVTVSFVIPEEVDPDQIDCVTIDISDVREEDNPYNWAISRLREMIKREQ